MRYRRFGNLDWQVSVLGLNLGGLPLGDALPAGPGRAVDRTGAAEEGCVRLIRHAIDHGVNYLDLGYPYDLARERRVAEMAGLALQGGYRGKVRIAVTIPVGGMTSAAAVAPHAAGGADPARAFEHHLDVQLEWLGIDRADFCVLGRIDRANWPAVAERGLLQKAEAAVADGRVGSLGFAFHDQFQMLKQVLRAYDRWTFAQFQYSYMDVGHDPGSAGLAYAAEQGLAVVVTEPLKQGRLTREPPGSAAAVWASAPQLRSLADWGLRFVWNQPAVSTAVCGIESMNQLVEDLALADGAEAGALSVRDELAINRVRDAYDALKPIDCASCRPCLPCPEGIDIPRIFEIYNDAIMYDDVAAASRIYREEGHGADQCSACGLCESRCSRNPALPIIDWLRTAHDLLAKGESDAGK